VKKPLHHRAPRSQRQHEYEVPLCDERAVETVASIGGYIVAQYFVDVRSRLRLYALDGSAQGEIARPGLGSVGAISGREDNEGQRPSLDGEPAKRCS